VGAHELIWVCVAAMVCVTVLSAVALWRGGGRQDRLVETLREMNTLALEHAVANSEDNRLVMQMHLDREAARAHYEELRAERARRSRIVRAPLAPKEPEPDIAVDLGRTTDSPD